MVGTGTGTGTATGTGTGTGTVADDEATRGDSCCLDFAAATVDTRGAGGSGEILPLSFGLSLTILFKVVIALFAVGVLTRFSCIVLVTLSRVTSYHKRLFSTRNSQDS